MSHFKVLFLPQKKEAEIEEGENLIRAGIKAGVHINASCGGEGVCGKCRVIIEEGTVDDGITEMLSEEEVQKGYRQACLAKVKSNLVVRVPTESAISDKVLNMPITRRRTASIKQMNLNDLKEKGLFTPPVEKKYLELPEPTAQDNLPDVTRLISFLKLRHDEHRMEVDLSVIRKISDVLRKDDFKVTATLARPVHKGSKTHIINIQPGDTTDRNYAIAMDVGTTTVYGQVLDLFSGEVLSQYGDFNAQISYGEDIISRLVYAEKEGDRKSVV